MKKTARSLQRLLALILAFALASFSLFAAPDIDRKHLEKIKRRVANALEHHRRVTIETMDHRLLEGVITEATADTFLLLRGGNQLTLSYADITTIKWPSGLSREIKGLILAAVVVGALVGCVALLGGFRG